MQEAKYKVTVIGGGTGLPIILRGLKDLNAYISAVVTVADDGGSSGGIRDYMNVVPPGDIRNCMCALSQASDTCLELFQYRFDSEDAFLAGHPIGNLLIAGLKEMTGSLPQAIEILSTWMKLKGQVLPAALEPLVLSALFEDGTIAVGESKIAGHRKKIQQVSISTLDGEEAFEASPKVVDSLLQSDLIVIGPGSLYTSILPNLLIKEIGEALMETTAEVVYVCNIMTQLGETEGFSDADHVRVLHQHLGQAFVDTVLVNLTPVPESYILSQPNEEYLLPVHHDFKGLRDEGCRVISSEFLSLKDGGAYHDTKQVVNELSHLLETAKLNKKHRKK